MKKRDYIFNMTNLIVSRIKFHAPIVYDDFIDFSALEQLGIDLSLPIFKFEKPMTRLMEKCFLKAKQSLQFNLILPHPCKRAEKKLGAIVVNNNPELNKLNINYPSKTNFSPCENDHYFKVNGEKLNLSLSNFFLGFSGDFDQISTSVKQFVLSGQNTYVELLNTSSSPKTLTFEINIPLEKGYHYFRKLNSSIEVTNLLTHEKNFFNFSSRSNLFSFSCIDGIENSTLARIHCQCKLTLKPKQKKYFFFNFGKTKFSISSPSDMHYFIKLAERKLCEKFDLQIKSVNKDEERLLNSILPQKIYMGWLENQRDYESERQYLMLKEKFAVKDKNGYLLCDTEGLRELKIFNGERYKSVHFEKSAGQEMRFMQLGQTRFFGKNHLTKKELSSDKECKICL